VFASLEAMMPVRAVLTLWCLLIALCCAAPAALAAPAPLVLDPSFGEDGLVAGGVAIPDHLRAAGLAVAPDRDVMVAGVGGGSAAVARYLPDGELDPSYGDHGVAHLATIPALAGESIESVGGINALVVDDQEGVLLLWQGANLTRIGARGKIETGFGSGGTVDVDQLDQRFNAFHLNAVAALPHGHILVAGIRYGSPQMVVLRLLPDGSLDRSFGDLGLAKVRFGGAGARSGVRRMAVAPDGKVVLAGYAQGRPALARLLPNGALDPSFGHNGHAGAPRWLHGQATALSLTPGGGMILGCACWREGAPGRRRPLLRFGPNGGWDRRFAAAPVERPLPALSWPRFLFVTARRLLLVGSGSGPAIRAFDRGGGPGPSLAAVPGVPRDRRSGVNAAMQGERLLLAWTPKHPAGAAEIRLERFTVR
jgi:uncharacterized delta-60 repeat protein